jgi:hypothetical protein
MGTLTSYVILGPIFVGRPPDKKGARVSAGSTSTLKVKRFTQTPTYGLWWTFSFWAEFMSINHQSSIINHQSSQSPCNNEAKAATAEQLRAEQHRWQPFLLLLLLLRTRESAALALA